MPLERLYKDWFLSIDVNKLILHCQILGTGVIDISDKYTFLCFEWHSTLIEYRVTLLNTYT